MRKHLTGKRPAALLWLCLLLYAAVCLQSSAAAEDRELPVPLQIKPAGKTLQSGSTTGGAQFTTTAHGTEARTTATSRSPRTGDDRSPVWAALMAVGLCGFGAAWRERKKLH